MCNDPNICLIAIIKRIGVRVLRCHPIVHAEHWYTKLESQLSLISLVSVGTAYAKASTMKLNHSLIKPLRILPVNRWAIVYNSDHDLLIRVKLDWICMILAIIAAILNQRFFSVQGHFVLKLFISHVVVQI